MSDESTLMCSYQVRERFRRTRFCLNRARWRVWFAMEDRPGMDVDRGRTCVSRCSTHLGRAFLPKGAVDVTEEPAP